MRRATMAGLLLAVVLMSVSVLAVGCGQSESEKAQEAYDEDVQDLKDAVAELQNEETYDSLASIEAAFQNVNTAFNDAVESGQDVADAKISGLQDAYDELKASIEDIDSDKPLTEQLVDVTQAIDDFVKELDNI